MALGLAWLAASAGTARAEAAVSSGGERDRAPHVLLIGLDGAEWDVIRPLVAEGRLPHIAGLIARGASGPLRSLRPTRSPAIWTTIATGKLPHEHGIYDYRTNTPQFWPRDEIVPGGKRELVTSNMRRCRAIWNVVGPERTVAVAGWLSSWPAERVAGSMVTSYVAIGSPRQVTIKGAVYRDVPDQTHPPELYDRIAPLIMELSDVTPEHLGGIVELPPPDDPIWRMRKRSARATGTEAGPGVLARNVDGLRWSYANNTSYARIMEHLLREERPSLALVYLEGIDSVSHRFWLFRHDVATIRARLDTGGFDPELAPRLKELFGDVVRRYYVFTDGLVGSLLDAASPDTAVVLVSDHGFRSRRKLAGRAKQIFSGIHGMDGVILMAGPGIEAGGRITGATVADVTPTLLHLLGMPVARDMAGRVLEEPLTPRFTRRHPVRLVDSYEPPSRPLAEAPIPAPGIDEAILERLESLGYTDDGDEFTPGPGADSVPGGTVAGSPPRTTD